MFNLVLFILFLVVERSGFKRGFVELIVGSKMSSLIQHR
jgi:hypothetical protein